MRDDWLIILDEHEWRTALAEGQKSIASHRDAANIVSALGSSKKIPRRKVEMRVGKRMDVLKDAYRDELGDLLRRVEGGKVTEKSAALTLRRVFNEYFRKAYALGLQAQGVGARRKLKYLVSEFTDDDLHHIRTAVSEELRYMRKFLSAIAEDRLFMSFDNRLELYVQGLDGVFGGARIAALPAKTVLWWAGPRDKNKCESCTYLLNNSPYLPTTLPTTPRAGDTLCLSRCRDKIVARKAVTEEVRRISAGKTLNEHVHALERIREDRKRRKGRKK